MASPPPVWRTPVNAAWAEADHNNNDDDASAPPKRLSGPGTTRQTRRLQLRNAGFKAPAVPSRKVTPKSISSSTNWSAVSGIMSGSDAENVSPAGARVGSVKVEKRKSSGILQEIGTAGTLTKPRKQARPRVTSGRVFGHEAQTGNYDGTAYDNGPMSPPPPRSGTIKARSVKTRAKMNPKRRSVSGEARMYIDHLEAELSSVQTQLSAINSPTVTREQSSKMRTLNTETRQLQEEVAEWEAKYEQRVQEEVETHCEIESTLRSQLRKLEEGAEETKYRLQELESELEASMASMEAAEAANVHLERRLEIMGDLLATSPTKIDLPTAETAGARRRHQRPKSMLPRFPTASSLVASPERQPRTQPTSPFFTYANTESAAIPDSLDHAHLALDTSFCHSDAASDAGSVFSESGPATGSSITSTSDHLNGAPPHFNPWTLQAAQSAKVRPVRRMRRFGAGSACPKPLILPSTSHWQEHVPASAPPLERSETTPAFSFPGADDVFAEDEDSPSSQAARRRASTTADESTLAKLAASPLLRLPRESPDVADVADESLLLGIRYPASAESQMTTRIFSSLGSAMGRNLMDELCAVRTFESSGSVEASSPTMLQETHSQVDESEERTVLYGKEVEEGVDVHSVLSAEAAGGPSEPSLLGSRSRSSYSGSNGGGINATESLSAWDRLRVLFGDLWRSPLALAQHLVQTAQARLRIPAPLRNVQWWLVGVLLGPMARRRMLATPHECCVAASAAAAVAGGDLERQPLLEAYVAPSAAVGVGVEVEAEAEEGLVYGTMYTTPPTSPSNGRGGTITSGKGKKRVASGTTVDSRRCCLHHHHNDRRAKHSPWLWLKFSLTLAFAVGVAFKDGPASLLESTATAVCSGCRGGRKRSGVPSAAAAAGGEASPSASLGEASKRDVL
ncbi:hypothetical protein LTR36_005697 [Oleoguttula mirabilis]|uniref:Uncharacterized protein n=1 Tax=Oleoguttula mirabilis TaxID=1507867 RepID=A0AAV9JDR3_9PEZI|nr:hypothetical protein LTR36_005697 [Oleoguttula mirabilis]